jgi:hypothetical protein
MLQCHPDPPIHSRECPKRGQKPGNFFRWTASPFSEEKEKNNSLKMKERSGNVIENKGPAWKAARKAGISMKTKEMLAESGNVVEKKGGRW